MTTDRELLTFIAWHAERHGYPPTVREIAARFGYASTSSVQYRLDRLEREGRLRRNPSSPRTLVVV